MEGTVESEPAFVFDMDGTIVPTENIKARTHCMVIRQLGGACTEENYKYCIGQSFARVAAFMQHAAGIKTDLAHYKELFDRIYRSEIIKLTDTVEGVKPFLARIKKQGFKLGLVSSSDRWMIDIILKNIGCESFFDAIVSKDDILNEKPFPDPYLKIKEMLGVRTCRERKINCVKPCFL